jgi:DNA polymerase
MSTLRGQTFDVVGSKIVVTYHPAALLRNTDLKRAAWEDLQFIQRLLKDK